MNALRWLEPAVVAAVTWAIMGALGRKNGVAPTLQTGLAHLRLPKAFIAFGWLSMAMAAAFFAGAYNGLAHGWTIASIVALAGAAFAASITPKRLGKHGFNP